MAKLFNVHTTWGEGEVSPLTWIEYAKENKIDDLIFIDFVPPNKWEAYKNEMLSLKKQYPFVKYGIEVPAKVLKDTPLELFEGFDLIGVSERCFGEKDDVTRLMEQILLEWTQKLPLIYWIRPGWWYKNYGKTLLGLEYYVEILRQIPENKIILEVNRKYNVPPPYIPSLLDELGYRFVVGVDASSPNDLPMYELPILGFTFADAEE